MEPTYLSKGDGGSALRVLVVEDEWLVAEALARALARAGHVVVGPAATSVHALVLIGRESVSVAVLDVRLRDADTTEAVAAELQARGIPFVVTTGEARERLPSPLQGGRYLPKPASPDQVLSLLPRLSAPHESGERPR